MLSLPRKRVFAARSRLRTFRRVRARTVPAGVPIAGTGGEDVAEREILSVSRALRVPPSKQVLKVVVNVSSDASGDILQAWSCTDPTHSGIDPLTAATNWSALDTLYDLYKPEMVIVEWFPLVPNNVSGTNFTSPISLCFDSDSLAAPASEDEVLQYSNSRTFDIYRRFRYVVKIPKRTGSAVSGYLDVAAPSAEPACIKAACTELSASTAYGRLVFTQVVRMRAQR